MSSQRGLQQCTALHRNTMFGGWGWGGKLLGWGWKVAAASVTNIIKASPPVTIAPSDPTPTPTLFIILILFTPSLWPIVNLFHTFRRALVANLHCKASWYGHHNFIVWHATVSARVGWWLCHRTSSSTVLRVTKWLCTKFKTYCTVVSCSALGIALHYTLVHCP